ncbi:hypothetical protein J1614_003461 [Plenodomus biglobosus]|nr:hypothetical protein J1614_003461 [Plenodomus biglobosus]
MSDSFRIVLRDVNRHDTFETREFDLPLHSTYPVGRASKNVAKRDLMPAPHNAYIDSPVISREHAVLSATLSHGTPQVYITDSGSMHGTMVNGRKLLSNTPTMLATGDMLQFGVDVNRNEDFFVARKYEFEAHLARPYSLGFAVPDADSEEEETDIHARRGSQNNPLVLDDSDAGSDMDRAADEKGEDDDEVTMIEHVQLKPSELSSQHLDDVDESLLTPAESYPESAMRTTFVAEDYSDGEDSVQGSTDGEDGEGLDAFANDDTESVTSSEAEAHHSSDSEAANTDGDDVSSPLVCKASDFGPKETLATSDSPFVYGTTIKSRNAFTLDKDEEVPEAPLSTSMFGQNPESDPYVEFAALPRPPWPADHPLAPHNRPLTNFIQFDNRNWSDFAHAQVQYMDTTYGHHRPYFSPPPPPPPLAPLSEPMECYPRGPLPLFHDSPEPARQAQSLQTPPPMLASDVVASTPQPVRRTKVSIEEIVEDRPLTPASVNNMKRKADVLEEEHTFVTEDTPVVVPESSSTANEVIVDAQAIQTAAVIAQRPKKQPKSVLAKVGLTAKYLGLGTAGAFAAFTALSTLPDAFFM